MKSEVTGEACDLLLKFDPGAALTKHCRITQISFPFLSVRNSLLFIDAHAEYRLELTGQTCVWTGRGPGNYSSRHGSNALPIS